MVDIVSLAVEHNIFMVNRMALYLLTSFNIFRNWIFVIVHTSDHCLIFVDLMALKYLRIRCV